jgi:hypothetical protein
MVRIIQDFCACDASILRGSHGAQGALRLDSQGVTVTWQVRVRIGGVEPPGHTPRKSFRWFYKMYNVCIVLLKICLIRARHAESDRSGCPGTSPKDK